LSDNKIVSCEFHHYQALLPWQRNLDNLHAKFAISRLVGVTCVRNLCIRGRLQSRTNKCWHLNFYHRASFCCHGDEIWRTWTPNLP